MKELPHFAGVPVLWQGRRGEEEKAPTQGGGFFLTGAEGFDFSAEKRGRL